MLNNFQLKNFKKGFLSFVLITFMTFAVLLYFSKIHKSLEILLGFNLFYGILILALIFSDYLLGGLRIYLFSKEITKQVSFKDCFNANLGNIFLGTVTPMQTGGGLAQLYILKKAGLEVSETIAVSIFNFFSTVLFIYLASLFVMFFGENILGDFFISAFQVSVGIFTIVIFLLVWSLFNPKVLTIFFQLITKLVSLFLPKKSQSLKSGIRTFKTEIKKYKELTHYYIFQKPLTILLAFFTTAVLFTQKYFIAFLILKGLGVQTDFEKVFCVQVLINLIAYFSPTPGASGISEITSTTLTSLIVPETSVAVVFTVLWRFFLTFLGTILGGFILTKVIVKSSLTEEKEVEIHKEIEIGKT
ncbi:flippase-like domain-containing protein [bacterium]|nr:flippase-like domain-containing protein [bacterium]